MRIGIDGRAFQGKLSGIGRYAYELCSLLDELLPKAQFFVYTHRPIQMPGRSDRWILRHDSFPLIKHLKPIFWLKTRVPRLCKRDNLDIFIGSATFLPKLSSAVNKIAIVYDLNFKIVPETMSFYHRLAHSFFFRNDVLRADTVISISKGTSERLYKFVGRRSDAVIYPSTGKDFQIQAREAIQNILNLYKISEPYILSVGTGEPRKNLKLLIEAFLSIKNKGLLPNYKLVLVGGRGWKNKDVASLIKKDNSVHILSLGFIPNEHLPAIYSGAAFFIFPSIYEGYGMPVLEARACGTKVITTDIPELREAGGSDTVYIKPNFEGIFKSLLEMEKLNNNQNINQFTHPSWEDGARKLAELIKPM